MTDETSLDVAGLGKLAKAIPAKAWMQIVDTACCTFREVVAPLTASTGGIGRLIDAKFDRLVDAQKVLAADTFAKAAEKASRKAGGTAKDFGSARVVLVVMEMSSLETDPVLRELWANLLADEISSGNVHPEFPTLLSKFSAQDAQVLAGVAQSSIKNDTRLFIVVNDLLSVFSVMGVSLRVSQERTYIHEHLESLKLIAFDRGAWGLTLFGQAFLSTVAGEGRGVA